jgi:hypothetical protein
MVQHFRDPVHGERFGDEVEGPGPQGSHRGVHVPVGRHDDDGKVRVVAREPAAEFDATHAGHSHVGQHGVDIVVFEGGESSLGRGLRSHLMSEILERFAERHARFVVVLDDQQAACRPRLAHRHDPLVVTSSAVRRRSS